MSSEARRERQDLSAFAALIATPGDLSTGFVLPANGDLYVACSDALVATTVLVDVGTRELGNAPSAAGRANHIGWFERGVNVVTHLGAPGTISLYIRSGLGVLLKIGEG